MTLIQSDLNMLKSLPCFTTTVEIFLLADGMSQTCFKVTTPEQDFLAKKLNHDTARIELDTALICSRTGLSPRVIYHNNDWLVTDFIYGKSLVKSELNSTDKISMALALMAKLHQLPASLEGLAIPALDSTQSVNRLFTNPTSFSARVRLSLDSISESLTHFINNQITLGEVSSVLCHGDINYTNIIVDTSHKAWLIDFECAHLAPVEFDLAMYIAVNNIPAQHISEVVTNYIRLSPSYRLNIKLLNYYILYSYFINGLWYLDNINDSKANNLLRLLAVEQWSAFDSFANKELVDIPKLLPIIS